MAEPSPTAEPALAIPTAWLIHELRTPATVALVHAQLLRRRSSQGTLEAAQPESAITAIESAAIRIAALASRLERGNPG